MARRLDRLAPRHLLLGSLGVALAFGPSDAAHTTFNPSFNFGLSTVSNVQYVGTGDRQSDTAGSVEANLPVRYFRGNDELRFNYQALYSKYSDEEALDNLAHFAELVWTHRIRRQFRLTVAAEGALTQEQGNAYRDDETNFFIAQRTERRVYGGRASFRHDFLRQRWQWGLAVSGLNASFRAIDDFQPDPEGQPVSDQQTLGGTIDIQRLLGRRYYGGVYFGYAAIQNEAVPDERIRRVGVEFERRVAERSSFGIRLGWFGRELVDQDVETPPNFQDQGLDVSIRFSQGRELGPFRFGFNVGAAPSTGGGIAGTSTNYFAGAQVTNSDRTATWNWEVALRYAVREPSENDALRLQTFSLIGEVERRLGRTAGIRLRTRWVRQQDDDPSRVDGEFVSAAVRLVWYPLGGRRIAVATGE